MNATLQHYYSIIAVFYTMSVAWTFVTMYHVFTVRRRRPWYRDPIGRHLMSFVVSDAIVFTFLASAFIWPVLATYNWYMWAYLIVGISGIPFNITWRVLIVWRYLGPKRRNAIDNHSQEDRGENSHE